MNSIKLSRLPDHKLALKVVAPIMLLRNLNPQKLCNGSRLIITILQNNLIEANILTGQYKGEEVMFPKIPLIPSDYLFNFRRHQFPIKLCFYMTINKSQGQSFKVMGLDLETECFAHGQLYVGCSRACEDKELYILAKIIHIYMKILYEKHICFINKEIEIKFVIVIMSFKFGCIHINRQGNISDIIISHYKYNTRATPGRSQLVYIYNKVMFVRIYFIDKDLYNNINKNNNIVILIITKITICTNPERRRT